jgi:hypothetical protein
VCVAVCVAVCVSASPFVVFRRAAHSVGWNRACVVGWVGRYESDGGAPPSYTIHVLSSNFSRARSVSVADLGTCPPQACVSPVIPYLARMCGVCCRCCRVAAEHVVCIVAGVSCVPVCLCVQMGMACWMWWRPMKPSWMGLCGSRTLGGPLASLEACQSSPATWGPVCLRSLLTLVSGWWPFFFFSSACLVPSKCSFLSASLW